MRNIVVSCLAMTIAIVANVPTAHAQAQGAASLAWPDKNESAIIFASSVVQDMDKALKFYTQALEMKLVGDFTYADGYARDVFLVFADKPAAAKLALVKQGKVKSPQSTNDSYTHMVVQVPSIQAVLDRVPGAGGSVTTKLHRIEDTNTSLATIADPDGRHIGLLQRD